MKRLHLSLLKALMLIIVALSMQNSSFAQTLQTVTGHISDSLGAALGGVTVSTVNGKANAISGSDGNYSIKVQTGATLVFKYVGYTTKQIVVQSDVVNVILSAQTSTAGSDVVVTAFGMQRSERSLGFAATTVKSDDITRTGTTNFATALYGKVPGLQIAAAPGGSTSGVYMQLRGVNSMLGKTTPLIIMDGVPIRDGGFNSGNYWGDQRARNNGVVDINPEDIENITVLKGAAAAALYGSEGVNGVVIITTKSGKNNKKGFAVDVYANYFQDRVAYLPRFQNVRGTGFPSQVPGYYTSDENGFNVDKFADASGTMYRALVQGTLNFGPVFDGEPIIAWDGVVRPYSAQPDRYKNLFQKANNATQTVALSTNSDVQSTRFSVTNQHTEGLSIGSRNDKLSFSLNSIFKLGKSNELQVIANYYNLHVHNRPYLIDRMINNFTGMMPVFDNGDWYRNKYQTSLGYKYVLNTTQSLTPDENIHIPNYMTDILDYMWNVNKDLYDEYEDRLIASITDSWTIAKGLKLRGRVSTDYTNTNIYTKNSSTQPIVYGPSGQYGVQNNFYKMLHGDIMLEYTTPLSKDLSLRATGFYTADKEKGKTTGIFTNGGLSSENWFDLAATANPISNPSVVNTTLVKDALIGTVNLNYRSYLYAEGTVRKDRTSTMNPDNNSFVYPSANAGFILSDAFQMPDVFNYLKLRASWGIVGNYPQQYLANVAYQPANWGIQAAGTSSVLSTYTNFNTYGNLNIRPEKKSEWEFGLEARMFQNRVGFDATFFTNKINDQILTMALPYSSGAAGQLNNVGSLSNKGFELSINATPIDLKDFRWDFVFNYATYANKVLSISDNSNSIIYGDYDGNAYQIVARVGHPAGEIMAHPLLKDEHGMPIVDDAGLYEQDPNKMVSYGSIQSKGSGGLINTITYKNFALNFSIDYRYGGVVIPTGINWMNSRGITEASLYHMDKAHGGLSYYLDANGKGVQTTGATGPNGETVYNDGMLLDGVTKDGQTNTNVISQAFYFNNVYNWGGPQYSPNALYNYFIKKNNYIKMREVAITYNFPDKIASKLKANHLAVSLIGRNLFYFYRTLKDLDAEQLTVSNNFFSNANNAGSQPASRTYGITLRANF